MAVGPHEVNPIRYRVMSLQTGEADGQRVLTSSAAVESILAGAEGAMPGERDTVLDAVAVLDQGANLGVCLSDEDHREAPILQALYGLVMAVWGGFSQDR